MNGWLGLPRSTRCFTILVGPRWDRLPFKSATEETPGPSAPRFAADPSREERGQAQLDRGILL
jgi:hypothetical protein